MLLSCHRQCGHEGCKPRWPFIRGRMGLRSIVRISAPRSGSPEESWPDEDCNPGPSGV